MIQEYPDGKMPNMHVYFVAGHGNNLAPRILEMALLVFAGLEVMEFGLVEQMLRE